MAESKYCMGLVSVSFRTHTPQEIIKAAVGASLSCIEWGSDVHAPCDDIENLKQIAKLQKDYGISCSSYGTYFRLGETPTQELAKYIEAAKILGTDVIRVWCGTKNGADMTCKEKEDLLADCREAAHMAEEHGVTLCLECHIQTFTEHLSDAIWLMEQINSECFGMYWQPHQTKSVHDNLCYAQAIAPYTRHIHVFQWKGEERFSLNDGIDEWRGYLDKFTSPRTLLLEFMPDNRIESLPTEADALRIIIGESK